MSENKCKSCTYDFDTCEPVHIVHGMDGDITYCSLYLNPNKDILEY